MSTNGFKRAQRVADAVLFEGYVLYPYRASAAKNQYRWQFGVVAPQSPHEDGEPSFMQTECVIAPADRDTAPRVSIRARFLRPRSSGPEPRAWLEGVPCGVDVGTFALAPLPLSMNIRLEDAGVDARVVLEASASGSFVKLRLRLENAEPWHDEFDRSRDAMLRRSLVGAHVLLAVDGGRFESALDPNERAKPIVAACVNRHAWPVLVGDRGRQDLMLVSPIVLYDFPAVAAESRGDLCDAAEIDEILSLRILTLSDAEKKEARETDPRARRILDRVETMTPDELAALHGTLRSADFFNPASPPPDQACVTVAGRTVTGGSRVWLRPSRRADAMDLFLRGQAATVAGVYRDVDDRVYVAVTVDADPGASLHESFGRFFYFHPDEIEPMEAR